MGHNRVEIMTDQPGSLTLLFSSVQNEDLGNYRCTATYALNQQLSANFSLQAFGKNQINLFKIHIKQHLKDMYTFISIYVYDNWMKQLISFIHTSFV